MSQTGEGTLALPPALTRLGWDDSWQKTASELPLGLAWARVIRTGRNAYQVAGVFGETLASVAGTLGQDEKAGRHLPAIGDWVGVDSIGEGRSTIRVIFPRRTEVKRIAAGNRKKRHGGQKMQTLAANIDRLLIVFACDRPWTDGGLERYLTMARDSGAQTTVLLNKLDLVSDAPEQALRARRQTGTVPVLLADARHGSGMTDLQDLASAGETWALIGPSGAGKSTLLNSLSGTSLQRTASVNETLGKGRHTTTEREMRILDNGLILVDNPGLRELQVEEKAMDLQELYADILALGTTCRFRNCRHQAEPACAVQTALRSGELARDRYDRFVDWQQKQQAGVARKPQRR